MDDHLEIFLLGQLLLRLNGEQVQEVTSRKALALFIYLACRRDPVSRDQLADLLYSNMPQQRARANLSVLLNRLGPLTAYLQPTRQSIAFNSNAFFWLDTRVMEEQLKAIALQTTAAGESVPAAVSSLAATLTLYQGDFLAGFHLSGAIGFDEWAAVERERLHRLAVAGLEQLVNHHVTTGQIQPGLEQAARLLHLDPLHEATHRQMMLLLARSGRRSEALAHYQTCRQLLADELGVEPSSETTAVYRRLQEMPGRPYHNLPAPSTSFVGRETELAWIAGQLQRPACRLLTLVGPGGVGKTRLALEVARRQLMNFWHGVCFVPVDGVESPDRLGLIISNALKLPLQGGLEPDTQLLKLLQSRELLLILDSFEHLLVHTQSKGKGSGPAKKTGGVALLLDILQQAPAIKIMVTSRERLNLNGEWTLPVEGLPLPESAARSDLLQSGAVRLLLERGSRVRPNFDLATADGAAVARLCRLTGGMPLALELAAGWLKMLTCAEIAAEVARDLNFLSTSRQDVGRYDAHEYFVASLHP